MSAKNGESEPQNRRGGSFWRTFRGSSGFGSGSFCEEQIDETLEIHILGVISVLYY